jgi:hypothetical protein
MEGIKLRHKLAFHALTAALVLNVVQALLLHQVTSGKVTVVPSQSHKSALESMLDW